MSKVLIRGGQIVTMNQKRDVIRADVLIEGPRIQKIAPVIVPPEGVEVIDAQDAFVIPGLIQSHTHLCQALFRGYADDLPLLNWLKEKIWPFEFHHSPESLQASARIALLEMQKLGTTSILDMATVKHTNSMFEAVQESGMRYWGGKCLMDLKAYSGPLFEKTEDAIGETKDLISGWHRKNKLMNYVVSPRFVVSCTQKLLETARDFQNEFDVLLHTHASESLDEVKLVKKRTGYGNIDYLNRIGLLNNKTVIVHGVHMTKSELKKMINADSALAHCPSTNLKLASGIAPIEHYHQEGLTIGIGADGAPCNNVMDPFMEMRMAALIQKPKFGPTALTAETAFELATLGGAKLLRREEDLGSIEEGKLADITVVDRRHPSVYTVENPYSALVYSCSGRDVRHTVIHGRVVVKNGQHQIWDENKILSDAKQQLAHVLKRV